MKEFIAFILLLLSIAGGYAYDFISIDLATFFAFILIIGLFIFRDRKNVKFDKIVFMRRTSKGRNFIDRVAKSNRGFWKYAGTVGVVIAVFTLVVGSLFLVGQASSVVAGNKEGGVKLLLPGPVSSPTQLPGVFVVPWWIWVIGVAIVIIPHEFMHGIMCRIDKVRIKSVGWILLVIIPGAFVEPDERQLKRAKHATKLRVYAAGSFANIVVAMIVLGVMIAYSAGAFTNAGVFVRPINNTPAAAAGLHGAITEIGGYRIASADDISRVMAQHSAGDTVIVKTLDGEVIVPQFTLSGFASLLPKQAALVNESSHEYQITLTQNPDKNVAYMGVAVMGPAVRYNGNINSFYGTEPLIMLLLWIYVFNLGIGIVNMLPIKPLDGGLLFEELVGTSGKRQYFVRAVSTIMLLVLLFNLIGPIFL